MRRILGLGLTNSVYTMHRDSTDMASARVLARRQTANDESAFIGKIN